MKMWIILLALCGILAADVGPSPNAPETDVYLKENGADYAGQIELNYVCDIDAEEGGGGPMEDREVEFSCIAGKCENEYWFYKLNPCFSGAQGHFEYELNGEEKSTQSVFLKSETEYEFELELTNAELSKISEKRNETGGICPLASVAMLGAVFFAFRQKA